MSGVPLPVTGQGSGFEEILAVMVTRSTYLVVMFHAKPFTRNFSFNTRLLLKGWFNCHHLQSILYVRKGGSVILRALLSH